MVMEHQQRCQLLQRMPIRAWPMRHVCGTPSGNTIAAGTHHVSVVSRAAWPVQRSKHSWVHGSFSRGWCCSISRGCCRPCWRRQVRRLRRRIYGLMTWARLVRRSVQAKVEKTCLDNHFGVLTLSFIHRTCAHCPTSLVVPDAACRQHHELISR